MTNEQKFIAANAAYIEELIRDVDRIEKSRDYVTNELNRECNKMVAAEKQLKAAKVKNLDLEFELADMRKQLKAAKESSEGLTQDLIQSEKRIAEMREQLEKMTGELDEADKLVTYIRTGKDEFRKECDRLTNSNKALKLALELKQLNGPDVAELKKEIRQLQTKKRYSADEISQWCRWYGDCDTCNHMQIDDEGDGECDLEIYGYQPFCWSSHVIATLDRIMTFDETTKKNTNKETKNE